jgi:hypothetical protein
MDRPAQPPLHNTAQNRVWLEIIQLSLDLLAWMPMLTLTGQARPSEPRRLCFRLFFAAGRLVTTGRSRMLRLAGPLAPKQWNPTRHSSRRHAQHQPQKAKRSTDSADGTSCKIEAEELPITPC